MAPSTPSAAARQPPKGVGLIGTRRAGPVAHEGLAVAGERVVLVRLGAEIHLRESRLLSPRGELVGERARPLGLLGLSVPVRARQEQVVPRPGHRDVAGASLLDPLLRAPILAPQVARIRGEDRGVAAELEVHRAGALGGVVLDAVVGQHPVGEARDEHRVELEALRRVDRHDLDRVRIRRLHRCPLLALARLDRLDVVEEPPQREVALQRRERMHLVQERREVPAASRRELAVGVGVELGEQARASDHLGEELGERAAGLLAQAGELGAELLEPCPALLGQAGHLVEVLEGLGHQERDLLRQLLVLVAGSYVLPLAQERPARGP
jgi:hypothetical protein